MRSMKRITATVIMISLMFNMNYLSFAAEEEKIAFDVEVATPSDAKEDMEEEEVEETESTFHDIEVATSSDAKEDMTEEEVEVELSTPSVATSSNAMLLTETPTLTIVGTALVGETLEAVFTGGDGTETYQWYYYSMRTWEYIDGATSSSYTFTSPFGRIQCQVIYAGKKYYAYVDGIEIRSLSVKITGTPNVGEKLTAELEPSDATVTFQWYRKDEYSPIAGATCQSYQLTEADLGSKIGVTVTGTGNYLGASAGIRFDSSIGEPLGEDLVTPCHINDLYGWSVYTGDNLHAITDGMDVDTYEWQRHHVMNGSSWWETESTEETYTVPERTGNGGWGNQGNGETSSIRLVITEVDGTKHYSYELICLDEINPGSGSNTFNVKIPKEITLDGKTGTGVYKVTVQGDANNKALITVTPSKTFKMASTGKTAIVAKVMQLRESFSVSQDTKEGLLNGVTTTGEIVVDDLTAGEWSGTLTFQINLDN